jgi:tetratricopeptide (TPR) repeat protein
MAGNYQKSAQTAQNVITIYPSDDEAPNALAYQYAEQNDTAHLQQALTLANGAIQKLQAQSSIDDNLRALRLAGYQDTLGWVQYRLGQYSPAIATLQKAIENDPREAETRYHLGMVYLALDNATAAGMGIDAKAAAKAEFQSALAANPTLASAKDELSKLGPDTTALTSDDIGDMLQ